MFEYNNFYKVIFCGHCMDEETRELEELAKEKLIDDGWKPIEGSQFRGYLVKVIDGDKRYYAPDDQGGYYLRK